MAQTMYSNPTSLRPEIGWAPKNALAGMMYHQNEQDYRQRFDQQTRLQDLGEQEQRFDFAEKREGAPLRQMERQLKGETIQGQLPFARDVARSGAQTQLAGDEFKRQTEYSPERVKSVLAEYTSKMDKAAFDKFQRDREQELGAIEQLMAAKKQFGDVYAVGQAKQLRERLAQAGIQTPPDFEDPRKWDFIYSSLMDSVKFTQEMKKVREQGELQNRGREISGKYTLEAARINSENRGKNATAARPPSLNNPIAYVNYLEQQIAAARESGDPEEIIKYAPQYEAALGRAYDANIKRMIELGLVSDPMGEKVVAGRDKHIKEGMRLQGFREKGGGTPNPTPAPGQSLKDFTPKDPLGLR